MPGSIPNDDVIVASEGRHYLNHCYEIQLAIVHYVIFACTTFLGISTFSSTACETLTQVFRSPERNVIFQWGTMLHILGNSPYTSCKGCV
jgi:hypothetical protein